MLDSHWTVYNAWWNPLDKGNRAHTYEAYNKQKGTLKVHESRSLDPVLYRVVDTDYSTYALMYHCEQAWLDFYTKEYFDVWTPDGTISDETLTAVKATITEVMSKKGFDTETLVAAQASDCRVENSWGLI